MSAQRWGLDGQTCHCGAPYTVSFQSIAVGHGDDQVIFNDLLTYSCPDLHPDLPAYPARVLQALDDVVWQRVRNQGLDGLWSNHRDGHGKTWTG